MLIDSASLSQTVDAINASLFAGRSIAAAERRDVARWIAARQGLPGCYAGTFAGFPSERSKGIVLFTGERITSAGVLLPMSQTALDSERYGTRHRAAIGISEQTDAVVVVVSEESADATPLAVGEELSGRISLRLPESLKTAVEAAANQEGISTNAWLVRTIAHSLHARTTRKPGRNRMQGYAQG